MALRVACLASAIAALCALAAWRVRRPGLRRAALLSFGVGVAASAYLFAAAALLRPPPPQAEYLTAEGERLPTLHMPDPDLGWAAPTASRVRAVRRAGGATLYDVVYTFGTDGLRVTRGGASGPPIVFFGCSFTFGDGVGDDETLPARVSAGLGFRVPVVNRGVGGYGPHQMLRALETGRAPIPPGARVLYQGIGDHVRRVAGKAPWDDVGPRYVADGDGVRFAGPMHAPFVQPLRRAARGLVKYGLLPTRVFGYEVTDDERELYVRIVAAAAARVRDAGGRFTVVLWDEDPGDAALAARLRARGLEVWLVSDLLPGVDRGPLRIDGDGHPGPELDRRLGAAIAARLLAEPPSASEPVVLENDG